MLFIAWAFYDFQTGDGECVLDGILIACENPGDQITGGAAPFLFGFFGLIIVLVSVGAGVGQAIDAMNARGNPPPPTGPPDVTLLPPTEQMVDRSVDDSPV